MFQDMVDHWRQHHAGHHKEHQAREERIQAGKPLPGFGTQRIYRSHAAEQHGCVQEGVGPGKPFNPMVDGHSEHEGSCRQRKQSHTCPQHTLCEVPMVALDLHAYFSISSFNRVISARPSSVVVG